MVTLINKLSGGEMLVHESRVEEYLAAGHRLPATPVPDGGAAPAAAKPAGKKTRKGK